MTEKIKSLAREERELTRVIVEHIAEVDRRKLFLAMAYSSLFTYLTVEVGYSSGAAQRRIDAARLLQRVPEVAQKIESGAINLSQISKLQQIARLVRKEGHAVSADTQRSILEKLEHKGAEQTDLILAQEFQVPVKIDEKRHVQRDESVRVELTFTKDEMELINRAREILSNKTGGGLKDTILEMAARTVKASEPKVKPPTTDAMAVQKDVATAAATAVNGAANVMPTASPMQTPTKTITQRLRREILARDKCCQYKDKITDKICGSKIFLELDHMQPKFANGSNSPENLRSAGPMLRSPARLCKNHNIYRYRAEL